MMRLLLLVALLSCHTPVKNDANARLAAAFCDCTVKLAVQDKRAAAIADGSDIDQILLNGALEDLQKAYDAAVECLQPALSEYGQLDTPDKLRTVTQIIQEKCPDQLRTPNLVQELLGH
jgi:hypothetical protein